jgi:hypothetical protein
MSLVLDLRGLVISKTAEMKVIGKTMDQCGTLPDPECSRVRRTTLIFGITVSKAIPFPSPPTLVPHKWKSF